MFDFDVCTLLKVDMMLTTHMGVMSPAKKNKLNKLHACLI